MNRQLLLDISDAFYSLKRRPLRSFLSSLGIGIGVAALIAMLSISEGAKQKALAKISSLGTDTLRIEDFTSTARLEQESLANLSVGLTAEDVEVVANTLGQRAQVGSFVRQNDIIASAGGKSLPVTLLGVSYQWLRAESLSLDWGRTFDRYDETSGSGYMIVGFEVGRHLGLNEGDVIQVGDVVGEVVGKLAPRGNLLTEGTGLSSLDFDSSVMMPVTAMVYGRQVAGQRIMDGMVVSVADAEEREILDLGAQVKELLLSRHRMIEDFSLVVPVSLLREARESQRLFTLVMGAIAGLSLLVGGIGVMNVMLANISEQTREIGLRMSLGASRGRIIWYYLWNAVLLTFSGGVWGTFGGVVLAYIIQSYAGWVVAFSYPALCIAPLAAVVTGIVFGLHPASRAASLDPAIALRES